MSERSGCALDAVNANVKEVGRQVYDQVGRYARRQVHNQVSQQVIYQAYDQVHDQVWSQVKQHVLYQVLYQVHDQVWRVGSQVKGGSRSERER